ncbi:glycosyltransferase family 4 protein [Campylobacter ureolyticus]|uniref:glycosyltransferase family 4 protein n=1 Tax=Campylobacter ureolyticus TaxID=827 RepID=UPI00112F94A8|nr:glycosyltransferase family 4 protein [Campylobacter ureolyticus]MCZ6174352.1 glycosyltransferase family 4 protein [Campylobacter ureolyticus]
MRKNILLYNVTTAIKIGGIEIFFHHIAKEISKNNKATICCANGNGLPEFLLSNEDIDIVMFKNIKREKIINLGKRFQKFIERVLFFYKARNFLKKNKFDVVVIHKPFDFFVCAYLKKINKNIKTVFVSGGEDFYFFDKYFIKYIDKVISVSKENAKILASRYKNIKISICYNGVDKDKFYPDIQKRNFIRDKFHIKNNEILLGSVGRVVGLKGFELPIKALLKIDNNSKFLLIGDGEELENLKKMANELNLKDRVIFAGLIPNEELCSYYNAMDIYLQPSIGNEAFGITVIEALSSDKIAIVSDNGGMKEIIKDGVNGYKFKINDLDDLANKINLVLKNKEKLNPRKSIEGKYEWKNFAAEILN